MLKLKETCYDKVAPLLEGVPFNTLFARAVIERDVEGEVYADSAEQPQTAYIVHPYGMSLLVGNPNNSLFNEKFLYYLLDNKWEYRKQKEWLQRYPAQWDDVLKVLLKDKLVEYTDTLYADNSERDYLIREMGHSNVICWNRVNFSFRPAECDPAPESLPEGFELKRIDASMQRMPGSVLPQFFWGSYERFLEKGIGFGIVKDGRIVSAAFSAFIRGNELEIGIETAARYRGNGFATHCCYALIRYCLENGFTPVWSCRKENFVSLKLAERLGFRISGVYPYYSLPE